MFIHRVYLDQSADQFKCAFRNPCQILPLCCEPLDPMLDAPRRRLALAKAGGRPSNHARASARPRNRER